MDIVDRALRAIRANGKTFSPTDIKSILGELADRGRGSDNLIAHINPREAALLKRAGGSGRINPRTGLLEFDDTNEGGGGSGGGGGAGYGDSDSFDSGSFAGAVAANNEAMSSAINDALNASGGGYGDPENEGGAGGIGGGGAGAPVSGISVGAPAAEPEEPPSVDPYSFAATSFGSLSPNAPGIGYAGPTSLNEYTQNMYSGAFPSAYGAPAVDPMIAENAKAAELANQAVQAREAEDEALGLSGRSPMVDPAAAAPPPSQNYPTDKDLDQSRTAAIAARDSADKTIASALNAIERSAAVSNAPLFSEDVQPASRGIGGAGRGVSNQDFSLPAPEPPGPLDPALIAAPRDQSPLNQQIIEALEREQAEKLGVAFNATPIANQSANFSAPTMSFNTAMNLPESKESMQPPGTQFAYPSGGWTPSLASTFSFQASEPILPSSKPEEYGPPIPTGQMTPQQQAALQSNMYGKIESGKINFGLPVPEERPAPVTRSAAPAAPTPAAPVAPSPTPAAPPPAPTPASFAPVSAPMPQPANVPLPPSRPAEFSPKKGDQFERDIYGNLIPRKPEGMARGGYANGGPVYDPMGNVTMPPEEGFAPSPIYDKAMDAIAKSGAAVGSPVTRALQTAADVYSEKSREAAAENEALRQQAMRNMQGELGYAGMPLGAGQMLLSQLGTATLPLTAAAKTAGYAATQATGNPRFGENVEMLSGFVDPSHVGMLKAAAPMAGAAAARQAVQTARELSPLGLYSHGAEAAAALQQAKGSPEQIIAQLRSAGVRPAELFSTGIADEAATNALRTKIESEMSPRIAQAEEALKSLTPGTKEFKDAERQLNNLKGTMRSEMDRALVIAPDWVSRPSVTREEIAQHLREQMPVVEEKVLGGVQPTDEAIRQFHDISPELWADMPFRQYEKLRDEFMKSEGVREPTRFDIYNLPGGENYREIALTIPGEEKYRVPEAHNMGEGADVNRVAHIRMADRTGPNGEKILHVEELQSDWGQQGRTEGFKDPNFAKWRAERDKLDAEWKKSTEEYKTLAREIEPPVDFKFEPGKMSPREYERQLDALEQAREKRIQEDPRMQALDRRRNELAIKFGQLGLAPSNAGVARGPYVTSTEGWTDLALKRVLKEAAEGGYDRVVFTPGAEQAKRYDLSKQIDEIAHWRDGDLIGLSASGPSGNVLDQHYVSEKELSSVVGKELAEKIIKGEGNAESIAGYPSESGVKFISGEDLSVGGEGMKAYYDKMVPKRLQELVRKHDKGAKVGYIEGALPEDIAAPGITITPQMRESILRGQPHMAEGGVVEAEGFDKGGSIVSKIARFKDAPAKRIADWEWRPLKDVATDLALTKVPPHVQAFGDYMKEISEKAAKEGLTTRDLLKAYTTTRASIQRQAVDADKIRALGMDIPSDVEKVRPEGAWAEWLMTPMGKKYLDAASKGTVEGNAVADAIRIMAPFGRHETDVPNAMKWAAENIPGRESAASDLVARALQGESPPSAWREFTSDIRGIGPSKSGFFASLVGRGDQPTLDARQIILNTGRPTKESSKFIARGGGEGGVEAVERLANRQRALNLELPSEYDPFYQHLAHHSIWDKVGDEVTTHGDIVRAMRESHGGAVDDDHNDRARRAEGGRTEEERRAIDLANEIESYENTMRAIAAQPSDIRSMTHAPERPRAPVAIEGGFIGKRDIGSAPYDVAKALSVIPQAVYDLKTAPLYAAGAVFPPAAAAATALDVAEGVASGSPAQVAAGALGAPGKVAKYGLAPLTAGVGLVAPDEAEAAGSKVLQKALNVAKQTMRGSDLVAKDPLASTVPLSSRNPSGAIDFGQGINEAEYTFTRKGDLQPWKEFDPVQAAKERALIAGLLGDRSAAGSIVHEIGGVKLTEPVNRVGGGEFQRSTEGPEVWASRPGAVKNIYTRIARQMKKLGADLDEPVLASHVVMGVPGIDSTQMMAKGVLRQIEPTIGNIDPKAAEAFDATVRKKYPKWPGILNPVEAEKFLAEKEVGKRTSAILQELDKAGPQKGGLPNLGLTRFAMMEPRLISADQGSTGFAISKLDPRGIVNAAAHDTYPTGMLGPTQSAADYLGGTRYQVPLSVMFPDWWKTVKPTYVEKKSGLTKATTPTMIQQSVLTQVPLQRANQEWLDNLMLYMERNPRKWGYRTGGSVSHQAMMIAKDSARRPAAL